MTTSKGILQRRQTRTVAGLHRRVSHLERALGSLLIYMAAIGLIGPEDYQILREELEAAGIPVRHPDGGGTRPEEH